MDDLHGFPTCLASVKRSFEFCIKCLAMRQCCLCVITWKHALFISPEGIMVRSILTLEHSHTIGLVEVSEFIYDC